MERPATLGKVSLRPNFAGNESKAHLKPRLKLEIKFISLG